MYPFNSILHCIKLQIIVLLASNALVAADTECVDSPLLLIHSGTATPRTCEYVGDNFSGNCTPEAASHCPSTCDECSIFMCLDSVTTFVFNGQLLTCSEVANLPSAVQEQVCDITPVGTTCRATCGYCLSTVVPSSIPPSSPPSVTATNLIDMNFDEAGLDFGELDDYDYYYDNSVYDYLHPDIMLSNFGYYPGHLSPGTGYDYGVITPENAAFNKYGDPAIVQCVGGSFYVDSMWITSAWQADAPVDFYGTKNDGSLVTFSVTLSNITIPMFVDGEFDNFTDLASLVIDTPREGDIAVIDNVQIGVTEQCDMSDFLEEEVEEDIILSKNEVLGTEPEFIDNSTESVDVREGRPKFSPILPRLN